MVAVTLPRVVQRCMMTVCYDQRRHVLKSRKGRPMESWNFLTNSQKFSTEEIMDARNFNFIHKLSPPEWSIFSPNLCIRLKENIATAKIQGQLPVLSPTTTLPALVMTLRLRTRTEYVDVDSLSLRRSDSIVCLTLVPTVIVQRHVVYHQQTAILCHQYSVLSRLHLAVVPQPAYSRCRITGHVTHD